MKQLNFVVGVSIYLFFIGLSFYFYLERTVFIDTSFYLFNILKDEFWSLQHQRWGAIFTEFFPLLACKLGLSLKQVAMAYSVGVYIFHLTCFVIIYQYFKSPKLALILLLYHILMVSHSFFWIVSELPIAVSLLLLYLSILDYQVDNKISSPFHLMLLILLTFGIIFTHPLVIFACLFAIAYFILQFPEKRKLYIASFITFFVFYYIKSKLLRTQYDETAMLGLDNFEIYYPNYLVLESFHKLADNMVHFYYLFPLIFVISFAVILYQKKLLQTLAMLAFSFGYILLICVSNPTGGDNFYSENQFLILTIFIAFPFVYDVLPLLKKSYLQSSIFALIALIAFARIMTISHFYTDRLNWQRNFLAQTKPHKLIVPDSTLPKDILVFTWASAYEYWLLSTIETGVSRSIFSEEKPNEVDWVMSKPNCFVGKYSATEYKDFHNRKYFNFQDSLYYQKK